MERNTNLRALRLRHDIPLSELSAASDLSVQYISRAELGDKLGTAVTAVIVRRHERLSALERSFTVRKGRLLQPEEGELDE